MSLRTAHAPRIASCAPRPLNLTARLLGMLALRRQRNALAKLDDAALRDIGLTRRDALREANRPLWDAPATWRR